MTSNTYSATAHNTRRILRLPEVCHLTGYRRTSIFNLMAEGQFPAAKKLSPNGRAIGWDSIAVQAWIDAKLESQQ